MMPRFLLYPETRKILVESGLEERIRKKREAYEIPNGYIADFELPGLAKSLKEDGFYENLPEENGFNSLYKKTLNAMMKRDGPAWKINANPGEKFIRPESDEIAMFLGLHASAILDKSEIWDYRKFGFSSPIEQISAIAAMMNERDENDRSNGRIFLSRQKDGKIWKTNIAGNMHYDLSVMQEDVTEYETTDPFGFRIGLRPVFSYRGMGPRDSTEPSFMMIAMKYVEQEKIPTRLFDDNARELIEWGKSLGQRGGATTEHLFGGREANYTHLFIGYDMPLPTLDSDYHTSEFTHFGLFTGEGHYKAYIGPNKELVFKTNEDVSGLKSVKCMFQPEDIDDLIRGIIYQCARGLGRTSASSVLGLIDYKLSGKYDEDQREFEEFNKPRK